MNTILLLLSLLSPYFAVSASEEPVPLAIFTEPAAVAASMQQPAPNSLITSFDSLAGVSLYDTEEELLAAKGAPLRMAPDSWQNCMEYQYSDMSAGICEGIVLYVQVSPAQASSYGLYLNRTKLDPLKGNLREMLGEPHFVAEDGDVYMRGSTALKIYRNPGTEEWSGIDLFDGNSS